MDALIRLHQTAPPFELPDLQGRLHTLEEQRGKVVVLNFWSAECPWVERADRALLPLLQNWGEAVVYLPIAANLNESPQELAAAAQQRKLSLVLRDADQKVAKAYGAQTTPHFFLIDPDGILRYQGAFDDVTFTQRTPSKVYLVEAIQAVLRGEIPDPDQTPAYGCAIFLKPNS